MSRPVPGRLQTHTAAVSLVGRWRGLSIEFPACKPEHSPQVPACRVLSAGGGRLLKTAECLHDEGGTVVVKASSPAAPCGIRSRCSGVLTNALPPYLDATSNFTSLCSQAALQRGAGRRMASRARGCRSQAWRAERGRNCSQVYYKRQDVPDLKPYARRLADIK